MRWTRAQAGEYMLLHTANELSKIEIQAKSKTSGFAFYLKTAFGHMVGFLPPQPADKFAHDER